MGRKGIEWTAAMIEKMLEEYAVTFDRVLADDLHVSVNSVRRKAKKTTIVQTIQGTEKHGRKKNSHRKLS